MRRDVAGPVTFQVRDRQEVETKALIDSNVVSPGYFHAMGFTVTAGTPLPAEPGSRSCRVGVINEEAAQLYFGGDAVGGAVIDGAGIRTEIVGVVRSPLFGTSQRQVEPTIYFPMTQDFRPRMTLMLGTRAATDAVMTGLRRGLEGVTGRAKPAVVITLDEHLSRTALAPERIATVLVGSAAAIALALGVLGMSGGMADFTRQRRREFAVRVALGASRRSIVGLVLAAGARLAGIGAVAGVLGAVLVARWITHIMPNVGSLTLWVWLAGPLVLGTAVLLAGILPARRALMVNPLAIMRDN
jgi:hypothetical protein